MRFGFKKAVCLAAFAAMAGFGVGVSHAAITDNMNDTSNFHNAFNGETVVNNGNGTVSVLRTQASIDSGVDWNPNNAPIPILGNENLTVTPSTPVNGGYWNANILLFDASGNYLAEKSWLGDTNSTQPQTVNIVAFAATNTVPGAAEYWLRLRMDPYNQTNTGFAFDQISTAAVSTPEPATLGLLGIGALATIRRRRA